MVLYCDVHSDDTEDLIKDMVDAPGAAVADVLRMPNVIAHSARRSAS